VLPPLIGHDYEIFKPADKIWILPELPDCPVPKITHAIRLAAAEIWRLIVLERTEIAAELTGG
jgi:hypothetical protein